MRPIRTRIPASLARWSRVLLLASLTGVLSGLAAAALEFGLHEGSAALVGQFTHLGQARIFEFQTAILLLPAAGGLLAGLAVFILSPGVREHGTDMLIRAFHLEGGRMRLKGPSINSAAAVCVISFGGSAGPEGPIAALGAAIGSALGRVFGLTPRECRIMLVAGCGAGVGAIFQCPLGGALFASSVLYREADYETDAIVPAFVASVVGYSTFMPFWGYGVHLLQDADKLTFSHPLELVPYAILGPLCGLTCFVFRLSLRTTEHIAGLSSKRRWIAPMLGGLATGGIACALPQVMDGQYLFIQHAMDGGFVGGLAQHSWWTWAALFGTVALAKCVATGLTVGSGAPGGVLGPNVFIGGALGAFLGALLMAVAPNAFTSDPEMLRRALIPVGMAGVLSASMRVPLAAVVMVAEMTGGYGLIVPLMVVCVTSYIVGRHWGLSDEQVPTRAQSPAHAGDLVIHVLESHAVGSLVVHRDSSIVCPDTTLREMAMHLEPGSEPTFLVVEPENRSVLGIVSTPELRGADQSEFAQMLIIASDIMTPDVPVLRSDESLYVAVARMSRFKHAALPVVSRVNGERRIGLISRADIYRLVRSQLEDMSRHLMSEHTGMEAIDQEDDMYRLVAGVTAGSIDRVQRLLVPIQAIGMSLREADFRKNFGVHVIAVEHADGSIQCPPDADAPLQTSQRLLTVSATSGPATAEHRE